MRYEDDDDFMGQDDALDMMGAVQGNVQGVDLVGSAALSALGMYNGAVNRDISDYRRGGRGYPGMGYPGGFGGYPGGGGCGPNACGPSAPWGYPGAPIPGGGGLCGGAQYGYPGQDFDMAVNNSVGRLESMEHQRHMEVQRQLARAKYLPQVILPFDSASVATLTNGLVPTGTTATMKPSSSVPLRITAITVAESCAQFFNLTQIKISRLDWNVGSDGAAAENFIQNTTIPPMENAILPAGAQAIISAQNIDAASQRIRGSLFGIDLTPESARATS